MFVSTPIRFDLNATVFGVSRIPCFNPDTVRFEFRIIKELTEAIGSMQVVLKFVA